MLAEQTTLAAHPDCSLLNNGTNSEGKQQGTKVKRNKKCEPKLKYGVPHTSTQKALERNIRLLNSKYLGSNLLSKLVTLGMLPDGFKPQFPQIYDSYKNTYLIKNSDVQSPWEVANPFSTYGSSCQRASMFSTPSATSKPQIISEGRRLFHLL